MIALDDLRDQWGLGDVPTDFALSPNVTPGSMIPVITDPVSRNVSLFKWGLVPSWAREPNIGYKMINARAETISDKPSFRTAFSRRRCLIPADGFYEWKVDGTRKYPFLFTLKEKRAFAFAGLWERWQDKVGKELFTCTIITTEPNELVSQYHNRMPVILTEEIWDWMNRNTVEDLLPMLKPLPSNEMEVPQRVDKLPIAS